MTFEIGKYYEIAAHYIGKSFHYQTKIYVFLMNFATFLYVIIALGLSAKAPEYLKTLQYYMKIYIALFLIWRFNPIRSTKFTSFDAKVVFNAAIFLLAGTLAATLSNSIIATSPATNIVSLLPM